MSTNVKGAESDENGRVTRGRLVADLTAEQWQAVASAVERHGVQWKQAVREWWFCASGGPVWQRMRNTLGPEWLDEFDFVREVVKLAS